jgi:acyl carrier protein
MCGAKMDFLELINAVGKVVKKHSQSYQVIPTKDSKFSDFGYDSLDSLMLCIYIGEAYGLPTEINEKLFPITVAELEFSVNAHKTREPSSIQEVLDCV